MGFPTHQDKNIWYNDLDSLDDLEPLYRGNPIIPSPHHPLPFYETISCRNFCYITIIPLKFQLELSTQNTAAAAAKSVYWETSHLETLHCKEM